MHILFVCSAYKPAYRFGGNVTSITAMAEGLVARGHRVTVFTTNSNLDEDLAEPVDEPVDVDGVRVWYFRRREPLKQYASWVKYLSQSSGYFVTPALGGAMRTVLPDIDLVHTQTPCIYPTRVASRMALLAGKPVFYSQRGMFLPQQLRYRRVKKLLYINLIEKSIMRGAAGLIAQTQAEVESYRTFGLTNPCHVIPNGIEVARFRRHPSEGGLADLGIAQGQRVVLFLGRMHSVKGPDLLADAFIAAASRIPEAVLVLAGPDEQGLLQGFKAKFAARNLSSRLILAGMVTGDRKVDLLARADLLALPSTGEGLSNTALEALASGTPVIATPGCNLSILEEFGAGRVIERSVPAFADTIVELLSDPTSLAEMASQALALAKQQFSWDPILGKLEEVYRAAIEKDRTRGPA